MTDVPVLDLASLDPDFTQDPYPFYEQWRVEAPVRKVVYHGLPGWLVTRSEDIMTVLSDNRFSINTKYANPDIPRVPWLFGTAEMGLQKHLAAVDPPDHTRLRRLVGKVFTARRVEQLRPAITRIAQSLVDGFLPNGRVELLSEFAYPLAVTVISELLGAPEEGRAECILWSKTLVAGAAADPAEAFTALTSLTTYITELVDSKQASNSPDADLLTALVAARDEGDKLTDEEVKSLAFQLLLAGFETSSVLIGNGTLALLENPDQLKLLYERPELTANAVEEFLRYDGAVDTAIPRFTTEDVELGGVVIPKGEAIHFSLASANRDLPIKGDREKLDITREDVKHMAFAHGIHFCLGAPLARLEAGIAFRAILDNCKDLALDGDREALKRKPSPFVRSLTHLPVTFTAVAR